MVLALRKERGCVKGNGIFSKCFFNDIKDIVLAPCNKDILYVYSQKRFFTM